MNLIFGRKLFKLRWHSKACVNSHNGWEDSYEQDTDDDCCRMATTIILSLVGASAYAASRGPQGGQEHRASSVVKNGPVAAAKKKAGKLNGPCYRSCVKTSMGDAFRTDQFCAYSCSY